MGAARGSAADKRRRRRARTVIVAVGVAASRQLGPRAAPEVRAASTRHHYVRRKTGLEWLADKGKLTPRQVEAGERYGRDFRFSIVESGAALKSSLAALEGAGGGGAKGGGLPATDDYSQIIVEAREAITAARAALNFHAGMILACDLVCGRQQTPHEITAVRKEAEQIDTGLMIALDLLIAHYASQRRQDDI